MKFATSIVFAAAAATAVLGAPKPQEDGGHGVPPPATPPATTGTETTSTATPTGSDVPKTDRRPDRKIPFSASNELFTLTPPDADSWAVIEAPGVHNVTAHFAIKNQDKAGAKLQVPQPFAGIEVWMYQRSDGGVATLLIDGVALARLDYYNKTAGKDDPPVLVYENQHIRRDHHVLEFRNLEDPRVKKFGQFNIDQVLLTVEADPESAPAPPPPAAPEPATSTQDTPPPLSVPTTPTTPQEQSQTTPPPLGSSAAGLNVPKVVLSVAAVVAAALALF